MSQQGPIIVVSNSGRPTFAAMLDDAELFPVVEADWAGASHAIKQLQPAAVIVAMSDADTSRLDGLANQIAARLPYLPLIVTNPNPIVPLPQNAIPFFPVADNFDRLPARLRASLRVRTLHTTVMRRLDGGTSDRTTLSDTDPICDATVLLVGRGAAYPALSISLGQRIGVVGALSIEAAAKHLNTRDIDGIVISEGFSPRVVHAFLTVLAEDARFRNLPVVVTSGGFVPAYDLVNLDMISGDTEHIATAALPLIRQHAFEAQLSRTLRALDTDGLLDARTGLLTPAAFDRDLATAIYQVATRGGGFSLARFAFEPSHPRALTDGARIISRLMRQMDFGTVQQNGSVIVAFADTDLRTAQTITRRLSAVMRHTITGKRDIGMEPAITLAAMLPSDSAKSLMSRLFEESRRAAS